MPGGRKSAAATRFLGAFVCASRCGSRALAPSGVFRRPFLTLNGRRPACLSVDARRRYHMGRQPGTRHKPPTVLALVNSFFHKGMSRNRPQHQLKGADTSQWRQKAPQSNPLAWHAWRPLAPLCAGPSHCYPACSSTRSARTRDPALPGAGRQERSRQRAVLPGGALACAGGRGRGDQSGH